MRALVLLPLVEASDAGVPAAARLRRPARRLLGDAHDLLRLHGHPCELPTGGVTQGGDYGGGRGYGRGLADALEAVGGLGVGELQDLRPHGRHVEDRGDQVVGEGGILDLTLLYLDLLEQGEPEPLRYATLDLALQRLRVHGLPNILRRRNLHDPHEPELGVHLDHGSVRCEGELQMGVPLPPFVQRLRRRVVEYDRLLDKLSAEQLGERHERLPTRDDDATLYREVLLPELLSPPLEDALA